MSAIPPKWRERLLHMLLCPVNHENLRFLEAWGRVEGAGKAGENNPLNTTYEMAPYDCSNFNSIGVKNYRNATVGISATACTLADESYLRPLWGDMQKGPLTAEQLLTRNETAIKHWGTDTDLLRRVLAEV